MRKKDMQTATTADVVATWLVLKDGKTPTNVRLQALLYCAQGVSLAKTGKPLFSETIAAERDGAVVGDISRRVEYTDGVFKPTRDSLHGAEELDDTTQDILEFVYAAFGGLADQELFDLLCGGEHLPWILAVEEAGYGTEVPLKAIKRQFAKDKVIRKRWQESARDGKKNH